MSWILTQRLRAVVFCFANTFSNVIKVFVCALECWTLFFRLVFFHFVFTTWHELFDISSDNAKNLMIFHNVVFGNCPQNTNSLISIYLKKETSSFLDSVVVLHFQISLTFGKFPPRTFSQPQQQTTRVFRMKAFSIYILVNLINVEVLPKGISIMHKRVPPYCYSSLSIYVTSKSIYVL